MTPQRLDRRPEPTASDAPDQFVVVRFAQGWRILFRGAWRGRFDFQVDAIDAALRLLGDVRRSGRRASLLVQDRFGEVRPFAEP